MEKIGRGTWLDKVADEIIKREKELERNLDIINVESGLGASGIPHVGSIGDAIRAYGIKLALEDLGYKTKLIAYSDDMDGLRKVPEGLPDKLNEYIAKPVSHIYDPLECHESYGAHMSALLLDGLDKLNIEYEFHSAKESYEKGIMNKQIHKILSNSKKIGQQISEMTGQEKFQNVLPYYPICEECGRLYTAHANEYDQDKKTIIYDCLGTEIAGKWIEGCKNKGVIKIEDGKGKLSWKSEFAARWSALDIRFEAHGKDLIDSVRINDWVSDEILNFNHPHHIQYELFLDKSGKKISKSIGNVFTPQKWLEFGTPESLFLLMYKRITGTRNLSADDIPTYIEEIDHLENIYFNKTNMDNDTKKQRLKGLYEYIHHLNPPDELKKHVPFSLLIQLSSVSPNNNKIEWINNKLIDYGYFKEHEQHITNLIKLSINFTEQISYKKEKINIEIDGEEKTAISEIISVLEQKNSPEDIQYMIFEVAKKNGIKPAKLFKTLYKILIGVDRGPKLGKYITDIGNDKVISMLEEFINTKV
tara:strand:+ start:503 stop:2098 length:1596 start_codon:yes stop_codon:yes gene_type:complete